MSLKDEFKRLSNPPSEADKSWFRQRGYDFEKLLNTLLKREDLDPRSSYKADGEQIDGSFFLDGNIFLLEAKWQKEELPASTIYEFKGKVNGKLNGTIGIFISMSGYSSEAVDALTLGKSLNVILFGEEDIEAAIEEKNGFTKLLKTKLRMAAEEGLVYFSSETQEVTKEGKSEIETFTYDMAKKSIVKEDDSYDSDSDMIIICEGRTDRELLSLLATRILQENNLTKKIRIMIAMGKYPIPRVANSVREMLGDSPVLIVTDSDNDLESTKELLSKNISFEKWEASIPDPEIETWLSITRDEISRMRREGNFRDDLKELIESIDLKELAKSDPSFNTFYNWIKEG